MTDIQDELPLAYHTQEEPMTTTTANATVQLDDNRTYGATIVLDDNDRPIRAEVFGEDWVPEEHSDDIDQLQEDLARSQDRVQELLNQVEEAKDTTMPSPSALGLPEGTTYQQAVYELTQRLNRKEDELKQARIDTQELGEQVEDLQAKVRDLEAALADSRDQLDDAMELSQDQRVRVNVVMAAKAATETRPNLFKGGTVAPVDDLIKLAQFIESGTAEVEPELVELTGSAEVTQPVDRDADLS